MIIYNVTMNVDADIAEECARVLGCEGAGEALYPCTLAL